MTAGAWRCASATSTTSCARAAKTSRSPTARRCRRSRSRAGRSRSTRRSPASTGSSPARRPTARSSSAARVEGGLDVTSGYAAFELRGPRTRALLERLTAIDVRPDSLDLSQVRAGVVARVPALLARTGGDVYLLLVSADVGPDVLEIAIDAGAVLVGEEARASA